jgi:hypothetical protein
MTEAEDKSVGMVRVTVKLRPDGTTSYSSMCVRLVRR